MIQIANNSFSTFIIAELSGNHNHDFGRAVQLIHEAKKAGADAVKLQTYTPESMTIDCDSSMFKARGRAWEGKTLYQVYSEAYTPYEWQPKLKKIAEEIGLLLFSSAFDPQAVRFLEKMDVPAYKIASFEIVDIPLIQAIARTGKPTFMSVGMATEDEIEEAIRTFRGSGGKELILMKCTSAYPALPEEMNLRTIPFLAKRFGVPVGLSDHSLEVSIPIASVALGATAIEKHFTLDRSQGGPDCSFSLEPHELAEMVECVRVVERSLGAITLTPTKEEKKRVNSRRSLFVVEDVLAGEKFTGKNVRSIRPAYGLHTRYMEKVIGKRASRHISKGTPFRWDFIDEDLRGEDALS